MRRLQSVAIVAVLAISLGCAGPAVSSFRPVGVGGNLPHTAVERYRSEMEEAPASSEHTVLLEESNGWPLGILAYWRRGTVHAMSHGGDTRYIVTRSRGYGPLSMFYVAEDQAVFDADGRRLNGSSMSSVLFGHIAMFHKMDNGEREHRSAHLVHHLLNWSKGHGRTRISLFSAPNPVEFGG